MRRYEGYRAAIDLDDCMASMREPLHHMLNEESGLQLHWSDWEKLHVESLYGVTSDRFFELALQERLIERMEPHAEAVEFMTRLADAGIHATVLTARGWHPRGLTVTEGWLRNWGIPFTEVVVCGVQDVKADYIQDMDKLLFTVDDSSRHCNQYSSGANKPEYVFAYEMPWTLDLDGNVIKIQNLMEIMQHIEGL